MEKVVVKLGGSVITYKGVKKFPLTLEEIKRNFEKYARISTIKRLAKEIYEANNFPLIVVNGAGPFGHYLVVKQDELEKKEIIHESVALLNDYLVSVFKSFGIKAKSYAPFDYCKYLGNGEFEGIEKIYEEGLEVLKNGGILSTYGDIVPTAEGIKGNCGNFQVISGDDLMIRLGELWEAEKIINVVDVEGIYTQDPKKNKNAKLVKIFRESDAIKFESIEGFDVSGAMGSKVRKLLSVVKKGLKAQIISGFKKDNLKKALRGDENIGSLILP